MKLFSISLIFILFRSATILTAENCFSEKVVTIEDYRKYLESDANKVNSRELYSDNLAEEGLLQVLSEQGNFYILAPGTDPEKPIHNLTESQQKSYFHWIDNDQAKERAVTSPLMMFEESSDTKEKLPLLDQSLDPRNSRPSDSTTLIEQERSQDPLALKEASSADIRMLPDQLHEKATLEERILAAREQSLIAFKDLEKTKSLVARATSSQAAPNLLMQAEAFVEQAYVAFATAHDYLFQLKQQRQKCDNGNSSDSIISLISNASMKTASRKPTLQERQDQLDDQRFLEANQWYTVGKKGKTFAIEPPLLEEIKTVEPTYISSAIAERPLLAVSEPPIDQMTIALKEEATGTIISPLIKSKKKKAPATIKTIITDASFTTVRDVRPRDLFKDNYHRFQEKAAFVAQRLILTSESEFSYLSEKAREGIKNLEKFDYGFHTTDSPGLSAFKEKVKQQVNNDYNAECIIKASQHAKMAIEETTRIAALADERAAKFLAELEAEEEFRSKLSDSKKASNKKKK